MDHAQWTMGGFQPAPQHHHHQQHHAPPPSNATPYMPSPDQEIALARSQMFESVHHLSTSLRNAANQCDNFVKVISRHHPSAAATAFASNVGADFLALASGNGLGGSSGLGGAPGAGQAATHHPVTTPGQPGRKPMTKEEKKALRKERKANRDPNAPKRPPSAYLLFQNEIREEMRQRYKDLTYSEVLGKVSEAWKSLTEEQRKIYQDKTVESMARWNQEKKNHAASGGFVNPGADSEESDSEESDDVASAVTGQPYLNNGMMGIEKRKGMPKGMKEKKRKM